MNYIEHVKAAEKALEGAKVLMRQADERRSSRGADASRREREELLLTAATLLQVASVHANLARAVREQPAWEGGPR